VYKPATGGRWARRASYRRRRRRRGEEEDWTLIISYPN